MFEMMFWIECQETNELCLHKKLHAIPKTRELPFSFRLFFSRRSFFLSFCDLYVLLSDTTNTFVTFFHTINLKVSRKFSFLLVSFLSFPLFRLFYFVHFSQFAHSLLSNTDTSDISHCVIGMLNVCLFQCHKIDHVLPLSTLHRTHIIITTVC